MMAMAVNCLVSEARRNWVSGVMGVRDSRLAKPKTLRYSIWPLRMTIAAIPGAFFSFQSSSRVLRREASVCARAVTHANASGSAQAVVNRRVIMAARFIAAPLAKLVAEA